MTRLQNETLLTGLSDNYIRVTISSANKEHIGKEINVRIEKVENEQIFATYIISNCKYNIFL